jgi:hypothetical protein
LRHAMQEAVHAFDEIKKSESVFTKFATKILR